MRDTQLTSWIFKQSEQKQFPDEQGQRYVFDNRHSVRVTAGDSFLYLDKRSGGYGFTGHGVVYRMQSKIYVPTEPDQSRISRIYTAELRDFIQYARPLDFRPTSAEGMRNRASLGITDVNRLGWSRSIARVSPDVFLSIVDLAYRHHCVTIVPPDSQDFPVPDTWSLVKRRHSLERFKETVLLRQGFTCAICGTTLREVLDVAHISRYSNDVMNRANPANGIALCAYCHRAFDRGAFQLRENGIVSVADGVTLDPVALGHLSSLSAEARLRLIDGVDTELLRQRYQGELRLWASEQSPHRPHLAGLEQTLGSRMW